MTMHGPASTVTVDEPWPYALLVSFAAACFVGALIMDIVYWRSMSFEWETFSVWLLAAGLVFAGLAVIAALTDLMFSRRLRVTAFSILTGILVIVLSLMNAFVHSRDGYTAVVPTGITLSGIVVLIMAVAVVVGRRAQRRQYDQRQYGDIQ